MNIFNNFQSTYIPIYHSQNINNTIILTEEQYHNLILYKERNNEINILLKKYLYIQNIDNIDLLQNYSLIIDIFNKYENYIIVKKINEEKKISLYKVFLNKKYEKIYKNKNFYYMPFESYVPNKDEICLVYQNKELSKEEMIQIIEKNKYYIYVNENNTLINDFFKNNIKDIFVLLQLFVPQLPKRIYYNKYNLNEFMKNTYKKMYNEFGLHSSSLHKFFMQIQKCCNFTIFGGVALKYYYHKYNINDTFDFLQSNDYDLNVTYLENESYDNITYTNYIIYMIYYIQIVYSKKIIDKNISLNVKDEKAPYINMYMTFSNKEDMNIYIWFLSQHNIFQLKSYYSNIMYINDNQRPYIYKVEFLSEELNSILTLKYIENSIINVKTIIKLEVHNNQIDPLDLRVNKNYTLLDFIFRTDINNQFSDYDLNDKVYYNNPIFLMLVYIDLIQKYQKKCISVAYRKKIGKEEKDKMRYTFIVKYLLVPYIMDKKDIVLKKMFSLINEDKYKNILITELLTFECDTNIYNQMNQFYDFLIINVEKIIYTYFNNEEYRFIKLNDYNYDIIKYQVKKPIKKVNIDKIYIENIENDICEETVFKINDFLRILYNEKNIEYNIINVYNERLNRKLMSLENTLNNNDTELSDKISKLMKLYNNFENIKDDYEGLYQKIIKIKYKSKILYHQECEVIKQIKFINEKLNLIEVNVEVSNKDLMFKEKLGSLLKKQYKKYKEEEKKIKIAKKVELRRLEEIEKKKAEELKRIQEEEMRLAKIKEEEELKKELEIIRKKELIIKERNKKIQKYKTECTNIALYIPRKIYNMGNYSIKKSIIYIDHINDYINWIYRNVSFFTILKVLGLIAMIGIICYGKYLHYVDEQKHLEMVRAHESKIKYNQRYNYKYTPKNNFYKKKY